MDLHMHWEGLYKLETLASFSISYSICCKYFKCLFTIFIWNGISNVVSLSI